MGAQWKQGFVIVGFMGIWVSSESELAFRTLLKLIEIVEVQIFQIAKAIRQTLSKWVPQGMSWEREREEYYVYDEA